MTPYIVFVLVLVSFRGPVAIDGFETRAACEKELTTATSTNPTLFAGGQCVEVLKRKR